MTKQIHKDALGKAEDYNDPQLVDVAGRLTGVSDPDEASRIADMLLLFFAAGGTVLGCIVAATASLILLPLNLSTGPGIAFLLICVGGGGALGFLLVSGLLNMRGMVRWERKRSERAS